MPRLKRLLLPVSFETAQRKRKCSRNKEHEIVKGERCLAIREGMTKNSYCIKCADLILQKASKELEELTMRMDVQ